MLYAIGPDGSKVGAVRDLKGTCPGCRAALIPKCGRIKCHHWAHRASDCDPWYEPESEWHVAWKMLVRPECCEVVIGPHRADIIGNAGGVIELQHSAISADQIAAREQFYGRMVWLIDASAFRQRLGEYGEPLKSDDWVRWRHPRQSLMEITKKQYWDFGPMGIARVVEFDQSEEWSEDVGFGSSLIHPTYVRLSWKSREEWIDLFLSTALPSYRPPQSAVAQLGFAL